MSAHRMSCRRLSLAAAVMIGLAPTPATAQHRVRVGESVRLHAPWLGDSTVNGRTERVTDDSIIVRHRPSGVSLAYAWKEVESAEVRVREGAANTLMGTLGAAGAVTGVVSYVKWCRRHPRPCDADINPDEDAGDSTRFAVASAFVIGGALLGAGVGYLLAAPRWVRARVPMRVAVVPTRSRGVMFVASVRGPW